MIVLPGSNIRVLGPVPKLSYFDTQSVRLDREVTALRVWNIITHKPSHLLKLAFRMRDTICRLAGVRSIKGFTGQKADKAQAGEYLDFFLVEYASKDCLVLTERDRHLDVMTCIACDGPSVSITSSVDVHNWFGRLYMAPVGVAHRWIVRAMLRRLQKDIRLDEALSSLR